MAKYDIEKDLTQAVPDTAEQERQALARQVRQLTREKEQLAGQLDEALRKNKEYRADLDAYIALVNQKEGYLLSLEKRGNGTAGCWECAAMMAFGKYTVRSNDG